MSPEAVEKRFRRLLNIGDCAPWPPIVGHWEDGRFVVCDGRHDYLAALMMGRDRVFVCWLEGLDGAAGETPSRKPPNRQMMKSAAYQWLPMAKCRYRLPRPRKDLAAIC